MKKNRKYLLPKYLFLVALISPVILWLLISIIQWMSSPKGHPELSTVFTVRSLEALSVCVTSIFILIFVEYYRLSYKSYLILIIILIPITYFGAIISNLLSNLFITWTGQPPPTIEGYFLISSLYFFIPITLVIGSYGIIVTSFEARIQKENAIKAESLIKEARWQMLRYQINPHFLFNALNSIKAMLPIDQELPRNLICQLSEYFRSTLSLDNSEVRLIDEWNIVENYLEIQRTRFQENLLFSMEIVPEIESFTIPVFAVQILVENAVKYGMKTSEMPLKIKVLAFKKNNCVIIKVMNSGIIYNNLNSGQMDDHISSKTGIENLRKRLSFYKTCDPSFTLEEEDGYVIATIRLLDE